MSSKQLVWGILGSKGYWAKNIIKTLDCLNFEIGGLYDISQPNTIDQVDTVIENSDVVIVATNPKSHFKLGKKVLEAKKHLWLEKPATLSYSDASALVQLAAANNVKFHVDLTWLYDSTFPCLREILRFKRFGAVKEVNFKWAAYGKFSSDGVNFDLNPHPLSLSSFLFGFPQFVRAQGYWNNGVLETCHTILTHSKDFKVNIEVSWLSPEKIRHIQIITDQGVIESAFCGNIEFTDFAGRKKILHATNLGSPLEVQLIHFDECIKQNVETISNGLIGSNVVRLLELIEKSARNSGGEERV